MRMLLKALPISIPDLFESAGNRENAYQRSAWSFAKQISVLRTQIAQLARPVP